MKTRTLFFAIEPVYTFQYFMWYVFETVQFRMQTILYLRYFQTENIIQSTIEMVSCIAIYNRTETRFLEHRHGIHIRLCVCLTGAAQSSVQYSWSSAVFVCENSTVTACII